MLKQLRETIKSTVFILDASGLVSNENDLNYNVTLIGCKHDAFHFQGPIMILSYQTACNTQMVFTLLIF